MNDSPLYVWIIIVLLGVGTFVIRFSFLGLIGDRPIPTWARRMLSYTSVAVLPGLVAPLILFPVANDGQPEPARLIATAMTLLVGIATRSVLWAVIAGLLSLFFGLAVWG